MIEKQAVNIFWFRRDLRLTDNAGLFHSLKSNYPVIPLFIFDTNILDQLEDEDDARITFIYKALRDLNNELKTHSSSIFIKHTTPKKTFNELTEEFDVKEVFANHDYEPYARQRDDNISLLLKSKNISFFTYKDQVIFEKNEITKDNGKPYTVYSPYQRKWMAKLNQEVDLQPYPSEDYLSNFYKSGFKFPLLEELGFTEGSINFPDKNYKNIIVDYAKTRDFPGTEGTSRISVHLRFGTVSIRQLAKEAYLSIDKTWLKELTWREFYMMTLWHFPEIVTNSFKPEYDKIDWRNNEDEFKAWCEGKTGYPIVDAGMRQLNQSGWMHNRVRMIAASFLTKHLLIDWRWGEAYFARKLLDYDQASNVGGWQWATGCGNDAVPYFRIFNPEIQTKKFDGNLQYIRRWVAEFDDPFKYPQPIVNHQFARERALKIFKVAVAKS